MPNELWVDQFAERFWEEHGRVPTPKEIEEAWQDLQSQHEIEMENQAKEEQWSE